MTEFEVVRNFYNQTNYAKLHKNPPEPTESVNITTHAENSCTLETVEGMKERLANQAKQIMDLKYDNKRLADESYDYQGRYNHAKIILEAKTEQLNDYITWLDEQKAETTKYKQLATYYKQIANCLDDGLDD